MIAALIVFIVALPALVALVYASVHSERKGLVLIGVISWIFSLLLAICKLGDYEKQLEQNKAHYQPVTETLYRQIPTDNGN